MQTLSFLLLFLLIPLTSCASTSSTYRLKYQNLDVRISEYVPKGQARSFTAVIFPPTGGSTTLDREYAKKLAAKGIRTLILEDWSGFDESSVDPELHDRHIGRAKLAFEALTKKYPGPYRLLGTSLGGMYVAAIAAEQESVESWVTIASGAPFSFVLSRSDQEGLISLRDQRKPLWLFDSGDYEAMLGFAITQDILPPRHGVLAVAGAQGRPSSGAQWRQAKVLMLIATKDTTVPTEAQELLWRAVPGAQRVNIEAGHFWGIVRAWWSHGTEIVEFLAAPQGIPQSAQSSIL
ncbi:MAG: alpha/beta fold hydrolase [Bdellovibrio sp.]|jgi:hypothetical protein